MTQDTHSIAVCGAGIMGLMSAYMLARAKHSVTIYDPVGFPAQNASWLAGGMLAPYSEIEHMDESWAEAGLTGIQIWQGMGLKTQLAQKGSLLIAHEEDRYMLERFKNHLPANLQNPIRPQEIETSIPEKFKIGLFLDQEAHLHPHDTMVSLCGALKKGGVNFVKAECKSDTSKYDYIVDCRGMAAPDSELRGVKGETLIVQNEEFALNRPVRLMHPRYPLYIVPRENGVFMIGATNIESSDDSITIRSAMELMSALYSLHPSFGDAKILDLQAGVRPSYADNLPRIKTAQNVISCNGLYRHGFLLAPVMAECVRDYIAGKENKYWPLMTKGQSDDRNHKRAA